MKKILSVLLATLLLVSCSTNKQNEETKPEEEKAAVAEAIPLSGNKPTFKLTQNKVVINKGADVNPMDYLVSGNFKDVEVIKNVDSNMVGQQEIIYEAGGKQHVLKVEVVDSAQPTFPETAATNQEHHNQEAEPERQSEQVTPAPQPEPMPEPYTPAPTPQPQPEPEPEPVVPEPQPEPEPQLIEEDVRDGDRVFRYADYGGENGAWQAAKAWAELQIDNWADFKETEMPEWATGYTAFDCFYIGTTIKYGVKIHWY